ncbi:sulfur oxidation protein SoxY [mine drainage metagenome]|uniref:Sulfur oxidation protein SoxY n=1 Tax=mine drainage metagenome TaxID=410659 RepID=A0A1J5QBF2_9ZZZZ
MQRRNFLLGLFSLAIFAPINALAAIWNKAAFEAIKLDDVSKNLNVNHETYSGDIQITAPDRAENGAIVQVGIKSNIVNTESIAILVEKNPTALIANFKFSNGAEPFVVTRIKMAETSDIKVVVKAGNQYFTNSKNVVVLENGCG